MTKGRRGVRAEIERQADAATLCALECLSAMLRDPETSRPEALKAAALVLERVWKPAGVKEPSGDFKIEMKGE